MKKYLNIVQKRTFLIWLLLLFFSIHLNAQTISTIAGMFTGSVSYSGDGGPATLAHIGLPQGVRIYNGEMYICDNQTFVIRKVDLATNIITTFAGVSSGGGTSSGDGGAAVSATFTNPTDMCFDGLGNLFVADENRIRVIDASGIITTYAGTGTAGYSGDGGPATNANLNLVKGLVADNAGNIYMCDYNNGRVRRIDALTHVITTVAGNGSAGGSGDGSFATSAGIQPQGVAIDNIGNLYITEPFYSRIRKVDATTGLISSYAGNGTAGYSGDGGPSVAAVINGATGIIIDKAGNIFFSDVFNNAIRKINTSGIITTVAGNGTNGYWGDGGPATAAELSWVQELDVDCGENLYLADAFNFVIRKVSGVNSAPAFVSAPTTGFAVCENSTTYDISSLLSVNDADIAQTETWTITTAPANGTLSGFPTSGVSTGSAITPVGLNYTPTPGFTGTDAFDITVTDCGGKTDVITINVTVNALPAISGTASVCSGATTTLSSSPSGGIWSSSDASIAAVGSSSGIVTGIATGIATITCTLSSGCYAIQAITVSGVSPITGSTSFCWPGSGPIGTSTLSDATPGGVWSSSNTFVATINSSTGVVTGNGVGMTIITYSMPASGCLATTTVYVVPPITGVPATCPGLTSPLSDMASGGVWTSHNPAIASVDGSGVVTGVSVGTTVISYTLGGCVFTMPMAIAGPASISGPSTVCAGATITLTGAATSSSSSWTSSNPAVASISTSSGSPTAVITGASAGTATIYYYEIAGVSCSGAAYDVTVDAHPGPITGPAAVCAGATIALSDVITGGTWTSLNPSIATVGSTGIVTGVASGTTSIGYSTGPGSACRVSTTVSVNPDPAPISGPAVICSGGGGTATYTDVTPGGSWSSMFPSAVSIDASTGVATTPPDTFGYGFFDYIYYTLPTGCSTEMEIKVMAPITGLPEACVGVANPALDGTFGSTWSSHDVSIATVGSSSGVVTGVSAGTTTITCSLSGCIRTYPMTVFPLPTISGPTVVTAGSSITLTGSPSASYSTWSCSNPSDASISWTGGYFLCGVTGITVGATVTITYALDPALTCSETTVNVFVASPKHSGSVNTHTGAAGELKLTLFPNPNTGTITIAGNIPTSAKEATVEIADVLGRVVYKDVAVIDNGSINKNIALDGAIANGIYNVTVENEEVKEVLRFSLVR